MCRFKTLVLIFWLAAMIIPPLGWPQAFAEKETEDEQGLQFCVDSGKIYFFQPQTRRIFVYQTTTNRLSRILTLEKLGEDLKQSRSLSSLEKE